MINYGKAFTVQLSEDYFNKEDILDCSSNQLKVIKAYKYNWIRRLLVKLGFKVKMFQLETIQTYSK